MRYPCNQSYALRLAPGGQAIAGELEHVLSGERRAFQHGQALLAALAELRQAQTVREAAGAAGPPPR